MSYDFMTLSPEDFENLSRDLLSSEWQTQVEAFKTGRDAGIDLRLVSAVRQLRYSRTTVESLTTIIQCKRYLPDRFSTLPRAIRAELPKISKLKPDRYVLITSVGLTPSNKEEILSVLKPWCKGTQDIYGPSELNGLLNRFPDIQRAHFKLWISSTAVLERILHARIFNVTEDTLDALKNQMCRLVMHDGFNKALSLLGQHHHALILGNPGIGKSTLARMLMCHYVLEGFRPIVVIGNIDDAWERLPPTGAKHEKAVILYDDFLGEVRFDESKFAKNEEKSLLQLLARVRSSPNLRFILTTREYLLADAERLYGAFERGAKELSQYTLSLHDYDDVHRARILFNHLYFSNLPETRLTKLVTQKVYRTIVAHRHFNPRIVEGISNLTNSQSMSDDEYLRYIEREFDDPSGVWKHPFVHQISPTSRQLLVALWSFGGTAELGVLEEAVLALSLGERPEEVSRRFRDSLRELDGNFIATDRHQMVHPRTEFRTVAKFQNPSVEEYLERFVEQEPQWSLRLCVASTTFTQVSQLVYWAHRSWRRGQQPLKLAEEFWRRLQEASKQTEGKSSGRLTNYAGYDKPLFDPNDGLSSCDKVLIVFQIAKMAESENAQFHFMKGLVMSSKGWSDLLKYLPNDESEPYAVKRILEWVVKESSWSQDEKDVCFKAYREALVQLLLSDNIWSASIGSLEVLTETFGIMEAVPAQEEIEAFRNAVKVTAGVAVDNIDDADALDAEVEALKKVSQVCGIDSQRELVRLSRRLSALRDDLDPETNGQADRGRYQDAAAKYHDIDALFATLLDH